MAFREVMPLLKARLRRMLFSAAVSLAFVNASPLVEAESKQQLRRVSVSTAVTGDAVVYVNNRRAQEIRRGKKDNVFEFSNDGTPVTEPPTSVTPTLAPTSKVFLPSLEPTPSPTQENNSSEHPPDKPSFRPSMHPSVLFSTVPFSRPTNTVSLVSSKLLTPSVSPTVSRPSGVPSTVTSPSFEPSSSVAPISIGSSNGNSSLVTGISEKPYHNDEENNTSIYQANLQQDIKDHTVPVILTGFASATVFCAMFILCANQRDRLLRRKWEKELQRREALADDNSSEKSAMVDNDFEEILNEVEEQSAISEGNRSMPSWIHAMMQELAHYGPSKYTPPPNILPPLAQDGDEQRDDVDLDLRREQGQSGINPEELSISRVSTLTTSLMDGSNYFCGDDVERQTLETTNEQRNTDSDDSQGLIDPSIKAAMKKVRRSPSNDDEGSSSVCSSLTDGTNSSNISATSTLLGEDCVASVDEKPRHEKLSPDTQINDKDVSKCSIFKTNDGMGKQDELTSDPLGTHSTQSLTESSFSHSEQRDEISLTGEMKKLEKLISSIKPGDNPRKCGGSNPSVDALVRDVFVSCAAESPLEIGLRVKDAKSESSSPMVISVAESSVFCRKLFAGDVILKVNNTQVAGLSGDEVLKSIMASGGKAIKVTVISTLPCKLSSSIDYGMVAGRQEV